MFFPNDKDTRTHALTHVYMAPAAVSKIRSHLLPVRRNVGFQVKVHSTVVHCNNHIHPIGLQKTLCLKIPFGNARGSHIHRYDEIFSPASLRYLMR